MMAGESALVRRAVFLDRDGTINRMVHHPRSKEQIHLLPASAGAIAQLRAAGWLVIVVTNQSVVARGYIAEGDLNGMHDCLRGLLRAEGTDVDAIYYCPHHPEEGQGGYLQACSCRKPAPGLLLQAAADFGLALEECVLVGDSLSDVQAGQAAGCVTVLVRTGYGEQALRAGARPDVVVAGLGEAAEWILQNGHCLEGNVKK